jgi:hypothetical protein
MGFTGEGPQGLVSTIGLQEVPQSSCFHLFLFCTLRVYLGKACAQRLFKATNQSDARAPKPYPFLLLATYDALNRVMKSSRCCTSTECLQAAEPQSSILLAFFCDTHSKLLDGYNDFFDFDFDFIHDLIDAAQHIPMFQMRRKRTQTSSQQSNYVTLFACSTPKSGGKPALHGRVAL